MQDNLSAVRLSVAQSTAWLLRARDEADENTRGLLTHVALQHLAAAHAALGGVPAELRRLVPALGVPRKPTKESIRRPNAAAYVVVSFPREEEPRFTPGAEARASLRAMVTELRQRADARRAQGLF